MDISTSLNTFPHRQREYAFFLSFASFIGAPFFLGIYMGFLPMAWLSLLISGAIVWLCLTLIIKSRLFSRPRPCLQKIISVASLAYGGITLYAFFLFCQTCIFPRRPFFFFPICFISLTAYGAYQGIYALERTAKFTSFAIIVLLFLTAVSMLQKIWAQREFVRRSINALLPLQEAPFVVQTLRLTAVFLFQALVLLQTVDDSCDVPTLLRSIRRGLTWGSLCSALLYLLAVMALGAHSFQRLLYPIYDMLSLPGYADYLDRTEFLMLIIFLFCESTKTISILLSGKKVFGAEKKATPPR